MVVSGSNGTLGYISKFMIQSIVAHPDFSSTTETMNIVTSSADDLIAENSRIMGAVSNQGVTSPAYTNPIIDFILKSSYISDINYLTYDQSFSVTENSTSFIIPDLPCSSTGSISISFGIINYITTAPSWVNINSTSGNLTINAPVVFVPTSYEFYVDSTITGVTDLVHKVIKLTVLKWSSSNWMKCLGSNNLLWDVCNSGYILISGVWSASKSASELAQTLNTVNKSIIISIASFAIFSSLLNTSSTASLWMTINQLQIFNIIFSNNLTYFIR